MRLKLIAIVAGMLTLLLSATLSATAAPPANMLSIEASGEAFPAGMFALYEQNRAELRPNYITLDFVLLSYSQIRQRQFALLEQLQIKPAFNRMLENLLAVLSQTVTQVQGDAEQQTLNRNIAYLCVLNVLATQDVLQEGTQYYTDTEAGGNCHPQGTEDLAETPLAKSVEQELKLIYQAGSAVRSPLWETQYDYTQFKPRGRYTQSEETQRFFRSWRYASSTLFGFNPSSATGLSEARARQNALQAHNLVEHLWHTDVAVHYFAAIKPVSWEFGEPDDLDMTDVYKVGLMQTKGEESDPAKALVEYAIAHQKIPRILGGVVDSGRLAAGQSAAQALIGWRLIPSTYSADTAAMQELVYSGQDTLFMDCESCAHDHPMASSINGQIVKAFPSMYELFSLREPSVAQTLVDDLSKSFNGYQTQSASAKAALDSATDLAGLHATVIDAILQNGQTNEQRKLQQAAGFWIWQKYLALLYQKQSYTARGKGISLQADSRQGASLEPATQVYQALQSTALAHYKTSQEEGWQVFAKIAEKLALISTSLDKQQALSDADQDFLNNIDTAMISLGAGTDNPIVVDIHTVPSEESVLEVGTAYPVLEKQGKAIGAGFSTREFKWNMHDRLTIEAWQAMLRD